MYISLMTEEMHLQQNSAAQKNCPTVTYLVAKYKYGNHDESRDLYSINYTKPDRFTYHYQLEVHVPEPTEVLQSPHIQNEWFHASTKVV
jgi:hypothetical protein